MLRNIEEYSPWEDYVYNIYQFQEYFKNFHTVKSRKELKLPLFKKFLDQKTHQPNCNTPIKKKKITSKGIKFPNKTKKNNHKNHDNHAFQNKNIKLDIDNDNDKQIYKPFLLQKLNFVKRYSDDTYRLETNIKKNKHPILKYQFTDFGYQKKKIKYNLFR